MPSWGANVLRIRPFRAIRPVPNRAAQVASVPYDVVSASEARQLAAGQPHSFLHVVRSEIDLPQETNPYDDAVYRKARENFDRLLRDRVLVKEDEPRMFLYRQVMNHRPQIGLVCCCHIDDYAGGLIKKHENTRPEKEDDRTRHVLELNAQAEPVFLVYRDQPAVDRLMTGDTNERPLFHFVTKDGVTHTVWPVKNPEPYIRAFTHVPCAYIADGHHRTASAARAGFERRAANPAHTGQEEYIWFLAVLFPASQLRILPYHRVVKDLNGMTPAEVLARLATVGRLAPTTHPQPQRPGSVCIYLSREWRLLEFDAHLPAPRDPIASLDISLLHDRVLRPILGIGDQRTDKRIEFVGGIRGTEELERRVNAGEAAIAFAMYPAAMDQLMAAADAGRTMPPKTTWFEPKLRSGLIIHSLD